MSFLRQFVPLIQLQCSFFFLKVCNYPHHYICLLFTISTIMEVQWLFYIWSKTATQARTSQWNNTIPRLFPYEDPIENWCYSVCDQHLISIQYKWSKYFHHFTPILSFFPNIKKILMTKTKITENIAHYEVNFQLNFRKS